MMRGGVLCWWRPVLSKCTIRDRRGVPVARRGAVAALVCAAAACAGCAASGLETTAAAAANLTPAATAYVAVPTDARSGTKEYAGSGSAVAAVVAATLSQRLRHVQMAAEPSAAEADLAAAREGRFTYLIRPMILRWEDNDNAWLGGSDRARVLLETIDVASGEAADISVVEARPDMLVPPGELLTPAEALEAPLGAYAARLIQSPPAATARR
jgi:hypothetical protein